MHEMYSKPSLPHLTLFKVAAFLLLTLAQNPWVQRESMGRRLMARNDAAYTKRLYFAGLNP
jgi:hypothetical protein